MILFWIVVSTLFSSSFESNIIGLKGNEHAHLTLDSHHKPQGSANAKWNHVKDDQNLTITNGRSEFITREECKLQMRRFVDYYSNVPLVTHKVPANGQKNLAPLPFNETWQQIQLDKQDKLNVPQGKLRKSAPTSSSDQNQPEKVIQKWGNCNDNRRKLQLWSKKLISDKKYFGTYLNRTAPSKVSTDFTVKYLCVENSYKILLISSYDTSNDGESSKYILKLLTPYEYHNENIIQPLIASINSRYFPKAFHISLAETLLDGEYHSVLMEYVNSLDLFAYMKIHKLTSRQKQFVAAQMIYAVHLLHANLIVHRDIKPENFLIDKRFGMKLIDFSFSDKVTSREQVMKFHVGTQGFMAPEVVLGKYTLKCDWYSLGVSLFEVFTDFNGEIKLLTSRKASTLRQIVNPKARELVARLLTIEAWRLSNYDEIKKHNYFFGFDWSTVEEKNQQK